MPRSPAQSDFVFDPAPPALGSDEASAGATRWVLGLTWFMLLALVLLCLIGPHLPAGE